MYSKFTILEITIRRGFSRWGKREQLCISKVVLLWGRW